MIGLPLWIVGHTHAPALAVGLVSAVNAVLCIALQLPASRVGRQPRAAMGCYAVAAALLSAACLALAVSGMVSGRAAALLWLVVGACALTFAELLQVSAGWTVSYAIAPPERLNTYLSAFSLGRTAARLVIGPAAVTGALIAFGSNVWLLLCGVFAVSGGLILLGRHRGSLPDSH